MAKEWLASGHPAPRITDRWMTGRRCVPWGSGDMLTIATGSFG